MDFPEKASEVVMSQYLHANGYSREEIEKELDDLVEEMPELKEFQLVEAWTTSRADREGRAGQLVMKLEKDGKVVKVYAFSHDKKTWVASYGV